MIELDIDSLDEVTLLRLNRRIVERLQFLHQQKTAAALQENKIGSGVNFESPDGATLGHRHAAQSQDGDRSCRR